MQQCFISSGKTYHSLINRCISMRIETHSLPYHIGTFCTRTTEQSHFVHGIKEFPVGRLKSVNFRNGSGNNYAHYIGHVVCFNRLRYGLIHNIRMHHRRCFHFLLSCHELRPSFYNFTSGSPDNTIIQCKVFIGFRRQRCIYNGHLHIVRLSKNVEQIMHLPGRIIFFS